MYCSCFRVTGPPQLAGPRQRYVRGLYSGGTFCYEASLLLGETLSAPSIPTRRSARARALEDVWQSRAHTLIDLGDDVFTRGRPHPMIDHRLRNERIAIGGARIPQTAVILLDVVLGYGSHADPAGEIAPVGRGGDWHEPPRPDAPRLRRLRLRHRGRSAELARQEAALREAGMRLRGSNAEAVRLAAQIVERARTAAPTKQGSHHGASLAQELQVLNVGLGFVRRRDRAGRRQGDSRSSGRRRPAATAPSGWRSRGSSTTRASRRPTAKHLPPISPRNRCSRASGSPRDAIPGMRRAADPSRRAADRVGRACAARCKARSSARSYSRAGPRATKRAKHARRAAARSLSRPATITARSARWPASSARRCRFGSCATAHGHRTFSNFNEGLGKALRFGANGPEVLERLQVDGDRAAPRARRGASRSSADRA